MLHISDLQYRYPSASQSALQGVSFSASRGQVLGLLGPNGAGKTTLIGQLAGILQVQQGQIRIDGAPLAEVHRQRPTSIAIAPQEYAFYPTLSVQENLACFAGVGGLRGATCRNRINECIEFAQLQNYRKVQAQRLSGGLKRRLNMSIALLHRPELILFDEPTVGVDPQSRAFLLEAVAQLARQGSAVIYTSHYMEEVQAIADRIVVLDQGRVLANGSLQELLASDSALAIEVENEEHAKALHKLLTAWGSVTGTGKSAQLALHDPSQLGAILQQLADAGLALREVRFGPTDLEQLFMSLTRRSLRD